MSDLGQGPQRFNTHTHIISFSRAVVLKLGHKSKSPGDLVTPDGWAPPPEFFISRTRVGAENFHFCRVFRGCLMLPDQVPHFEKQRSRVLFLTSEPFATTIYEATV